MASWPAQDFHGCGGARVQGNKITHCLHWASIIGGLHFTRAWRSSLTIQWFSKRWNKDFEGPAFCTKVLLSGWSNGCVMSITGIIPAQVSPHWLWLVRLWSWRGAGKRNVPQKALPHDIQSIRRSMMLMCDTILPLSETPSTSFLMQSHWGICWKPSMPSSSLRTDGGQRKQSLAKKLCSLFGQHRDNSYNTWYCFKFSFEITRSDVNVNV